MLANSLATPEADTNVLPYKDDLWVREEETHL